MRPWRRGAVETPGARLLVEGEIGAPVFVLYGMKRQNHRLDLRREKRLPPVRYPAGHPVHVTLCAFQSEAVFRNPRFAEPLFEITATHSKTVACCLMPDRLHWLISDAAQMKKLVHSFTSYSTYVARTLGHGPRLWRRSYRDHVLGNDEDVREVAEHIVQNPVRGGLVDKAHEYPYQRVCL
jgi:REP element-mobilizing transposase RayT